jgi:CBS-domain-containing membrane protein
MPAMPSPCERGAANRRWRSVSPPDPQDVVGDRQGSPGLGGANDSVRRRLSWRGRFLLALPPLLTVLFVLGLVEAITRQRLLFASLASSAFQIYLDPRHPANNARTIVSAQFLASVFGLGAAFVFGHSYAAAAAAIITTIIGMILIDAVHPPAVPTSLAFSLRSAPESNFALFTLAVAIIAWLVVLERASLWLLGRLTDRSS